MWHKLEIELFVLNLNIHNWIGVVFQRNELIFIEFLFLYIVEHNDMFLFEVVGDCFSSIWFAQINDDCWTSSEIIEHVAHF